MKPAIVAFYTSIATFALLSATAGQTEAGSAEFQPSRTPKPIPPAFFGVHFFQLGEIGWTKDFNPPAVRDLIQDLRMRFLYAFNQNAYGNIFRQAWPARGDAAAAKSRTATAAVASNPVPGAEGKITRPAISAEACPVETIKAPTSDGHKATAAVRKPPDKGPFPAMIHLHGGLGTQPIAELKEALFNQQTFCRFLAAGYVVVNATFRSRQHDPQTRDALIDCLGIIDYVKKMPEVDPKSVVLWGDSGGGSLALELAGETPLCAIAAQEPATVLFTGMFNNENLGKPGRPEYKQNWNGIMADPNRYFTPELRKFTEEKISKINCPVLIAHGDKHAINKLNNQIFVPALKAAGKQVEVILYPGEHHGFSYRGTPAMTRKFFDDCDAFFRRHLSTQPKPLDRGLITEVPVD